MKKLKGNEIINMYLNFFGERGHTIIESASLIPKDDPTVLWINAGVTPLKKYFDGTIVPKNKRLTSCQKCIRTGDIESVGHTARHHTFFQMLGNFSIGDYFREEAITWAYELLTSPKYFDIDKDKLYVTVYTHDDDTYNLWLKLGIKKDHLIRLDGNFWEIGPGPSGPDTEIFYDRGEKYDKEHKGISLLQNEEENDRYIEIWNNVLSQFNATEGLKREDYPELPSKNIDTGMGLERLAVVVQDVDSIFDVDTICALRNLVCEISGKEYEKNYQDDVSIRLITDHIRSATFMISDGIMPSNEGRGYVLRRLIRRAARHGKMLGIEGNFFSRLSETVIEGSKDGYPELEEKKEFIFNVLTKEEEKFGKTIDQGLDILNGMEEEMKGKGEKVLSGANAFMLYDTYGFPLDLTKEILETTEGVTGVEMSYDSDEELWKTKVSIQENVDIREKVFYAMAKANCPIYEMQVKRVSLEDVFLELTEGEKKSAGKPESSQWKPVEDRSSEEEKTQEEKNGEPEKASDEKEGISHDSDF
mgnify:CR=1 FL=1